MLRVFAPAKVNLCLHVTGQRSDGYHLLDTLVAFADVGDWVTLGLGGPNLQIAGPEASGLGGENIITRLMAAFDAPDLAVHLHKNLPVASGIGGGSSDAAAAYRGLCALLGRPANTADAARLLAIGADVPMCAAAISARVQGIGEAITPLPNLAPLAAVLVNPRVHLPTPQVFAALTVKSHQPLSALPAAVHDAGALTQWLAVQRNDLAAPAIALAPVIADVLAALAQTGASLARMSGSGATCFGLYPSLAKAQAAAAALQKARPNWWTAPCTLSGAIDIAPHPAH